MKKSALIVAGLLLVSACSSGSDQVSGTTTAPASTTEAPATSTVIGSMPSTTRFDRGTAPAAPSNKKPAPASLETRVRAYTKAFLGGDAEGAYALLSERCHGEIAYAEFKAVVDQATDLYGDATITSYSATFSVEVTAARVTYELSDPVLNQTNERWLLEAGVWVNDEC
jgi:hypothetical protein